MNTPSGRHKSSRICILASEDQTLNRAFIVQMMQNRDLSCETVENGQAAVEACQKKNFGLILMDIQMTVMDRIDVTRKTDGLKILISQ